MLDLEPKPHILPIRFSIGLFVVVLVMGSCTRATTSEAEKGAGNQAATAPEDTSTREATRDFDVEHEEGAEFRVAEDHGDTLEVKTTEGTVRLRLRTETVEGDWPVIHLEMAPDTSQDVEGPDSRSPDAKDADTQPLLTHRSRDWIRAHAVPGRNGSDYLVVVWQFGGPGTCVWSKSAQVYSLVPKQDIADGSASADFALEEEHYIPLGGYLDCADGKTRACGCGSWEAEVSFDSRGRGTELTAKPEVKHANRDSPPADPPDAVVLEL